MYFSAADLTKFETIDKIEAGRRSPTQRADHAAFLAQDLVYQNEVNSIRQNLALLMAEVFTIQSSLKVYKETHEALDNYFDVVAAKLFLSISFRQASAPTTTADFVSRTGYYVSADVGIALVRFKPNFDNEMVPYAGVNFHLGPINKQKSYRLFSKCNSGSFWKNTSVIVGVTFNGVASGSRREDSLPASKSLLTGFGIRISDPIRLSGGVLWNKVTDPNPLVASKSLHGYPYIALSYDLDVAKYLRIFGNKIFGLKNNANDGD
ncbi:MAG: hypothetical protein WDO15_21735 [Bacteroidota bacterium]